MLTLHLAGRVSAKLPLILTALAAACKHPHTVWRSGVVRAMLFRDRIPSQQAFGTFPPFCKYDKQPATLLVTSPHVMVVVAMGSTTNMHNTRAQTSLRAAMGFSIEETMKLFWVTGEVLLGFGLRHHFWLCMPSISFLSHWKFQLEVTSELAG